MAGLVRDIGSQEVGFWRKVSTCEHVTVRIGEHYQSCDACCWPWRGAANAHGYGRTKYGFEDRAEVYAHRVAYRYAHQRLPIPQGYDVAHACDMPLCCNPSHLSASTHAANMAESAERGRTAKPHGGARPRKLTWALVAELRELAATRHYTQKELGLRFGVSAQMVSDILCGRSWGYPSAH